MARINILPNGTTSGNPSMGNLKPPKRRETVGWSHSVSKRLRKWLYSVSVPSLTGYGYSFTLTVRDCPPTADDWAMLRNLFLQRLYDDGFVRLQWLTEWQARGVPHLHGIVYFDSQYSTSRLIAHWLSVASSTYGASHWAQDSKEITHVTGWFDYLSKHAARSGIHYQRSPENVPPGWTKTGRVWGYRGNWDTREAMTFEIDQDGFYAYRRLVKKLHHSKVRSRFQLALAPVGLPSEVEIPRTVVNMAIHAGQTNPERGIYVLRRFFNKSLFMEYRRSKIALKVSDANQGRMMGTSDWIDQDNSIKIILWLGSQGYDVVQA